jgi:tetratricopeptide (TPR) repeat protein
MLSLAPLVHAHGDIHLRIEKLDMEIARRPEDVALLVKRGRLHLDGKHAQQARVDFAKAKSLAPNQSEISYYLAQAELALKAFEPAAASVQRFLDHARHDAARVRGLLLQGDICMAVKKPVDAAYSYLAAIRLSDDIKPEYYLKASGAYLVAGDIDGSLKVLDRGINRFGPLTTLQEQALAIETSNNKYDDALRRVDGMLASNARTPYLLYRKGLILKAMGSPQPSMQVFHAALNELDKLPEIRRNTSAVESLKAALLSEISGSANKTGRPE